MLVQARNQQASEHWSAGQSKGFVASGHDGAPYVNGSKQCPSKFGIRKSAIDTRKFVKQAIDGSRVAGNFLLFRASIVYEPPRIQILVISATAFLLQLKKSHLDTRGPSRLHILGKIITQTLTITVPFPDQSSHQLRPSGPSQVKKRKCNWQSKLTGISPYFDQAWVLRKIRTGIHVFFQIKIQVLKDEIQPLFTVHHVLKPADKMTYK